MLAILLRHFKYAAVYIFCRHRDDIIFTWSHGYKVSLDSSPVRIIDITYQAENAILELF